MKAILGFHVFNLRGLLRRSYDQKLEVTKILSEQISHDGFISLLRNVI